MPRKPNTTCIVLVSLTVRLGVRLVLYLFSASGGGVESASEKLPSLAIALVPKMKFILPLPVRLTKRLATAVIVSPKAQPFALPEMVNNEPFAAGPVPSSLQPEKERKSTLKNISDNLLRLFMSKDFYPDENKQISATLFIFL